MASNITSTIKQKIIIIHRKHPWIRIYFLVLIMLVVFGNISTSIFPVHDNGRNYENFAPGWASHDIFRSFLEPWYRWDTGFYLHIAKEGYCISCPTLAFLPTYPSLIRVIGKLLGGQYLLAALFISWSAAFGACFLLEERFAQKVDQKTAVRGIRNLLFFPTAFFFFAGYTESLFLFLVLFAWRSADRGQWLLAGVVGALATMTKFVGIVLVLPFGLIWLKNWRWNKLTNLFPLLLLPIAYLGWAKFATSIYKISPFEVQTEGWYSHFDWPWVGILGSVKKVFSKPWHDTLSTQLYVLAVVVAIFSIYWWLKRKSYPESIYMAVVIFISLVKITDAGLLGSVSRFVLILFPMYLTFAKLGQKPRFDRIFLTISIFLWMIYSAMFFTWNWVA